MQRTKVDFPAPDCADDTEDGAIFDRKIDILQSVMRFIVLLARIGFIEMFDLNHVYPAIVLFHGAPRRKSDKRKF